MNGFQKTALMKFICFIIPVTLIAVPAHAGTLTCAEALNLFKQSSRSHISQSPLQEFEWDAEWLETTMRWFMESIDPENLIYSRQELDNILQDPFFALEEEVQGRVAMIAAQKGIPADEAEAELRKNNEIESLRSTIREEKMYAFLREKAKYVDAPAEPEDAEKDEG